MSDSPLVAVPLRPLTIDPRTHPRGQAHISAASGLVCRNGRAYVIADDEIHLAVFCDHGSTGRLHRILPGQLPDDLHARKKRKPDFETLFLLPSRSIGGSALVAFGSGSRENRNLGVLVPLDSDGEPSGPPSRFDLTPWYAPLCARLGDINIEGAFVIADELVLLNRGIADRTDNAAVRYSVPDLLELIAGRGAKVKPTSIQRYRLGDIDGVSLGFTDGAALPGGGWVFTAVAENTADSFVDGPCAGAIVGVVSPQGEVVARHRLSRPLKVEGIDARAHRNGFAVCMVTDDDDPSQPSCLLRATLRRRA